MNCLVGRLPFCIELFYIELNFKAAADCKDFLILLVGCQISTKRMEIN